MPTTSRAGPERVPGRLIDEHVIRRLVQARATSAQSAGPLGGPVPARLAADVPAAQGLQISPELAATLIERIFDAGLLLAGASSTVRSGPARERMTAAVDHLDSVVREIRRAVFTGQEPFGPTPGPW